MTTALRPTTAQLARRMATLGLSPRELTVLTLYYNYESHQDIARHTALSAATVRRAWRSARDKLAAAGLPMRRRPYLQPSRDEHRSLQPMTLSDVHDERQIVAVW